MSVLNGMSQDALSKLTKNELMALIEQQHKNNAAGLMVKVTDKGGIFIKHDSFKEYSTAKEKEYVAGINIGFATAQALFNNPSLLSEVVASIKALAKQA